jgi:hypothetical protein
VVVDDRADIEKSQPSPRRQDFGRTASNMSISRLPRAFLVCRDGNYNCEDLHQASVSTFGVLSLSQYRNFPLL